MSGALGVALAVGQACGAANVRPYVKPFFGAPADTVTANPEIVVDSIVALLTGDSIGVHAASPVEGYVESEWHDAGVDTTARQLGSLVRYRFWVDSIGQQRVRILGEAAAQYAVDPSLPEREREMLVPETHPGWRVLEGIMKRIKEIFSP